MQTIPLRPVGTTRHLVNWALRHRLSSLTVLLLLLSSCGGSVSSTASQTEDKIGDESASEIASSASDNGGGDTSLPDLTGLRAVSYPALGGIRLGIEDDISFTTEGDFMSLTDIPSDGRMVVSRVSQTADGKQITTIDDFLSEVEGFSSPTTTKTNEEMSLFGEQLTMYQFRGVKQPGPGLFAARPFGYFGNIWWTPGPLADIYLAEIEGGVLAVGAIADTAESLTSATELMNRVVPTLTMLTADGTPARLPDMADRYETISEPSVFSPAPLDPDGEPEFTQLFSPVEPGRYQMGNLSAPIDITIDGGWFVAINVPTFVVFAELPPIGPGFRDIIFQHGVNAIAGVNSGPSLNTKITDLTDIEAFLSDPPPQLIVRSVNNSVTLGGKKAVRFELLIDPTASCQQGDPCQFLLTSGAPDFVKNITPGAVHRFWWIEDVPDGPLVISASTAEADTAWLDDVAAQFLSGIEFAEPVPIEGLPDGMPSVYTGPPFAQGTHGNPVEAIFGGLARNLSGLVTADDGTVSDVRLRVLDLRVEGGSIECAGQQYQGPFTTNTDQHESANSISIDTWGKAKVLVTQTSSVFAAPDSPAICTEITGTWTGTSGLLEGRSGSFSRVFVDSVETVTLE